MQGGGGSEREQGKRQGTVAVVQGPNGVGLTGARREWGEVVGFGIISEGFAKGLAD